MLAALGWGLVRLARSNATAQGPPAGRRAPARTRPRTPASVT